MLATRPEKVPHAPVYVAHYKDKQIFSKAEIIRDYEGFARDKEHGETITAAIRRFKRLEKRVRGANVPIASVIGRGAEEEANVPT